MLVTVVLQTFSEGLRLCQVMWLKWKVYIQVSGKTIVHWKQHQQFPETPEFFFISPIFFELFQFNPKTCFF